MPNLRLHFRLTWAEIDEMPTYELREYIGWLDELAAHNRSAAMGGDA